MAGFGFATGAPRLLDQIADTYKDAIPAQVRTYVGSLLGDRSTITNANFSRSDLAALRRLVTTDQAQLPQRATHNGDDARDLRQLAAIKAKNLSSVQADPAGVAKYLRGEGDPQWFRMVGRYPGATEQSVASDLATNLASVQRLATQAQTRSQAAREGRGAVQYWADPNVASEYPGAKPGGFGPLSIGVETGDKHLNALANTIGQFVYQTNPDRSVTIDDNYNWGATPRSAPRSVLDVIGALMHGDLEAPGAALMPTRTAGRPVHIVLPPPAPARPFGFAPAP